MSYGPNFLDLYRRAAEFLDKIMHGEIPVEQPVRFHLIVNLITAKALGLTIPETLLATADKVMEQRTAE
jgi:putative ABC transport system substrate-binding protein